MTLILYINVIVWIPNRNERTQYCSSFWFWKPQIQEIFLFVTPSYRYIVHNCIKKYKPAGIRSKNIQYGIITRVQMLVEYKCIEY